jgi:Fic family protein
MTLKGQPYLAGHYRGDPRFDCLRRREVRVQTPTGFEKTFPPELVPAMMRRCTREVEEEMAVLDFLHLNKDADPSALAAQVVESAAYMLGGFNVVHPFANGNGHVSRLLTFAFLARYGLEPRSWIVHSLQSEADRNAYGALFRAFRDGNIEPLAQFLRDRIAGR